MRGSAGLDSSTAAAAAAMGGACGAGEKPAGPGRRIGAVRPLVTIGVGAGGDFAATDPGKPQMMPPASSTATARRPNLGVVVHMLESPSPAVASMCPEDTKSLSFGGPAGSR
jgi:hypothetical protein